ncbi:MAG: HlyD family efflux transporter periplasmic adaptor subunit [Agathobacter sp.]|nr:HlyD family efflux transporter periplasmic adaptor subunit [Agathobacter sp.]
MRKRIHTLEQLKDSRFLFDKQIPAFGYMLIVIVAVFLGGAVVWSMNTPKVYTIQAQGTVTNTDASYVMCTYTGEIETSYMEEGKLVEAGDTLFTIKSTDYNLQKVQLEDSRLAYEKKISQYQKLVKSIKDNVNYFDSANPDDELYFSTFETYKAKVEQSVLDTSMYEIYGYSEEQIEAELVKNQGKISEIYYSTLQSAESAIQEAQLQIVSIDAQLSAISSGQEAYVVKASTSGILHKLADYKPGMVVQTTTTVATITPENGERVIEAYVSTADMARMHEGDEVQIVVDGLSQSVYGTIVGTVRQIDSNVTTQQGQDGATMQVFRVLIDMDTDYMISQTGDKVDVVNGMTVVARVQYNKVTYFNYVLEKLGFKVK